MGVLSSPGEEVDYRLADQLLYHRGPDDKRIYQDPENRIHILFRRLAIIDLDSGMQPVFNSDGSVVVAFNGEIYNYRELREELRERGYQFKTNGDAEVIAHGYEAWGGEVVQRLEGMFAILIWDENKHELHAFRDRFGIKPLYFVKTRDFIAFASEVKPLLSLPSVPRSISSFGVFEYLSYGYILSDKTIFESIEKVPQATHICVSGDSVKKRTYWEIKASHSNEDVSEDEILDLFDKSIELHLRSDVKLGAFLSGGYDSSFMISRASRLMPGMNTYTISFTEAEYNEAPIAELVAKQCGTNHQTLNTSYDQLLQYLPKVLWTCDEPLADSGILPNYLISEAAARDGCKVVLSGAGGDEIFSGYVHHVPTRKETLLSSIGPLVKALSWLAPPDIRLKLIRSLSYSSNPELHYLGHTLVFRDADKMINSDVSAFYRKAEFLSRFSGDSETARLYADLHTYLPDNLMLLLDRATMAASVEGRLPFLYTPLVEKMLSMKPAQRTPRGERKGFMRSLIGPYVPSDIFSQPKIGFNSPVQSWMEGSFSKKLFRVLCSEKFKRRPWWGGNMESTIKGLNFHQLWTLFSFELFCRIHLDRPVSTSVPLDLDELLE